MTAAWVRTGSALRGIGPAYAQVGMGARASRGQPHACFKAREEPRAASRTRATFSRAMLARRLLLILSGLLLVACQAPAPPAPAAPAQPGTPVSTAANPTSAPQPTPPAAAQG